MMESWGAKQEPDYYGSLEHLPLAPLRGKPPRYASRRQQDSRRGNVQKGSRGLSSSAGDLTTTTGKSKNSTSSNGGNWKGVGDGGGVGDLGTSVDSRGMSDTLTDTPAQPPHHQRHGSVLYSPSEQTNEASGHRSNRYSASNSSQRLTNVSATPTPQAHHQRHASVSYSTTGDSEQRRRSNSDTSSSSTAHAPKERQNGRERSITQTRQDQRQGNRNMANGNRTRQERLTAGREEEDSDAASPASTLERRQRSGSTSNTNSLKNYRELAAIPDHTLVKWDRSKSMNDISGEGDGMDSDREGKTEGGMKRAVSYSNTKDAVSKDRQKEGEVRQSQRHANSKDFDKEGRDKDKMRHTTSHNTNDAGNNKRNIRESRQTAQALSGSKRENQVIRNTGDREVREHCDIGQPAESLSVRGKSGREEECVEEESTITSSPTPSSSSSSSSEPSYRQNNQKGSDDGNEGVFVATPIFLVGSPTPSPPPSPPVPSTAHLEEHVHRAEQGPLRKEEEAALSTLRREILHLTRLKEEIELNLIRSQTELKEQVAGLRQERGGLEAVMEEREKRLHAQEEEIKDLKDTIAQLQTLVFASDGEARLQRQASDLQEQLREEKRYRLEETTQLRREVRSLASRLEEKEQQLAKYKSDPALSSWGSEALGKVTAGSWKTSLPDVRKEMVPESLGASVRERRRSFSSMSDSSDNNFSSVGSFISGVSWSKEDLSGRANRSTMRPSEAVESSGRAPTRSNTTEAPYATREERPRGGTAWPDEGIEVSRKSNIASQTPLESSANSYRRPMNERGIDMDFIGSDRPRVTSEKISVATLHLAPESLTVPLGSMLGDAVNTQGQQTRGDGGERKKTTIYLELGDYTKPGGSDGGRDVYAQSGREGGYKRMGSTEENRSRVFKHRDDYIRGLGERSGDKKDLPGSYTHRERDYARPGETEKGESQGYRYRERDYARPGETEKGETQGYRHREREYARPGETEKGESQGYRHRERNYARPGETEKGESQGYRHRERNYARPGNYEGLERTSNPITKSTVSSVHHQPSSTAAALHMPRPASPPPLPPRVTSKATIYPNPPQQTRSYSPQVTQDARPEVRSGVETSMRTSWMYKPVDGSGTPVEDVRWSDSPIPRVESGRQVAELSRVEDGARNSIHLPRGAESGRYVQSGAEYHRMEPQLPGRLENGRREMELQGLVQGRRTEPDGQGGAETGRSGNVKIPGVKNGRREELQRGEIQRGVRYGRRDNPGGDVCVSSMGEGGRLAQDISFITTTIHCLYNLPPLHHFFTDELRRLGVRSEVMGAVGEAFRALESGAGEERAMQHLREAVVQRDKIFLLHQDPPAGDFLSCLLTWLHNDLTPETHPQAPPASSVISRLFRGLRESLIVCPLRGEVVSYAMESFNSLTLSVLKEGAWTLQELIARKHQGQEIAWECRLCGHRHPCSHQPRLLQPPRALVLCLWRPPGGAARVLFPEDGLVLHIHRQHQQPLETRMTRSPEYQLVGVVTREGSSHHSAFCRRLDGGGWRAWAGQRVAAVSRREVLSQQAPHLLFYLQQEENRQVSGATARGEVLRSSTRGVALDTCV